MKELSIEEKARRYNEAIKRLEDIETGKCQKTFMFTEGLFDYIFPELKESKDERIRKWLIYYFKEVCDNVSEKEKKSVLDWLEKQGEKESVTCPICGWEFEKQGEQKPADKVEPKFHEGEWIVHHGTENIYQVAAVINNQYQLKYGDNYTVQKCADVDRCARLWDITKDAKDGDVLATDNGVCIFDGTLEEGKYPFAYCGLIKQRGFESYNENLPFSHDNNIHPATKEQRDLLFSKMNEDGYEWDTEKKELKEIIDEKQIKKNLQDNGFRRMFEQKPICSEEDEQYLLVCKNALAKYQVSDKWDATIISQWLENKLKSLKPQNTWKPSDEQIKALKEACDEHWEPDGLDPLYTLYQDLKRLK